MNIALESNTTLRAPPGDYCPENSAGWFSIPEGRDAGKKMFYFDYRVGEEEPKATIVFVHGNPESSYTYRHIRDAIVASGKPIRLIAMDHIGFGLSDQATYEMIDMHHSTNLLHLIRYLGLTDISLVVHDWGGPIGIGALSQEPSRVRNLLVMNTTIFPMPDDGYTYTNYPIRWLPWCNTPKLVPDMLWGGVAAYVVSHASKQGTLKFLAGMCKYLFLHGTRMIPAGSPEYVWAEPMRSKANAKSSKRNVLQTPYWGHGYRYVDPTQGAQDNGSYYLAMQQKVPEAWGPEGRNIKVCGYFGQWDACGKDSVIDQWHSALPQMSNFTFTFPDIGHFIEEYKGKEMAASILQMNELHI
jgi:pimeloyl-ACP methyl ester carboxylesterase